MADVFDELLEFSLISLKWVVFALLGVLMFPAWFLVIFVHDKWISLID